MCTYFSSTEYEAGTAIWSEPATNFPEELQVHVFTAGCGRLNLDG